MRRLLPIGQIIFLACCTLSAAVFDLFWSRYARWMQPSWPHHLFLHQIPSPLASELHSWPPFFMQSGNMRVRSIFGAGRWTNGYCVLSISYRYDHNPVFRPRSRKELDRSGNRRMSRPSWIGAVFGCQRNESRQELVWYVIRPDAGVESTNSLTAVEKYQDRRLNNSMFLFDRFCNTTGRGYARYLNQITSRSDRLGTGDSSSVEALGYYSTWFDGRWRLNCQQASGKVYLAREVSFTPKGWDKPLLSVTNSGSIECPGLTIAASGVVRPTAARSEPILGSVPHELLVI